MNQKQTVENDVPRGRPRRSRGGAVVDQAFARSLGRCDEHYRRRHLQAWSAPMGFEIGIVFGLKALVGYADAYDQTYGSDATLGHDGVLGEGWLDMARGWRALLNGELGRLDGGALDAALCDLVKWAGFEEEL